jgi:phosphate transport system protein
MTHPHIVKSFDEELQALTGSLRAMGDFAETQLADAVHALLNGDVALADKAIAQDEQLDALRWEVSSAAATVIARRQPLAADLDEVMASFRIAEDLERIGDLAKNIAKRATAIAAEPVPADVLRSFAAFADLAAEQLRNALATYVARDAEQAMAVRRLDEKLDELHTEIFRDIVSRMNADQTQVIGFVHLLFCAKNIERIGDHTVHIAEAAYVTATGHRPEERLRRDLSSVVGSDDVSPPE